MAAKAVLFSCFRYSQGYWLGFDQGIYMLRKRRTSPFEAFIAFVALLALILSFLQPAHADGDLYWKVKLDVYHSSNLIVFNDKRELARYEFECHLVESKSEETDYPAMIKQISLSDSRSVIGVSCPFGAHSQMLAIIDPYKNEKEPVFKVVGSYFAYFEEAVDGVNIVYDRYCREGVPDCDEFEQVTVKWPLK